MINAYERKIPKSKPVVFQIKGTEIRSLPIVVPFPPSSSSNRQPPRTVTYLCRPLWSLSVCMSSVIWGSSSFKIEIHLYPFF